MVRNKYIKYDKSKSGQLHSQEPWKCNWMFNIGEILKIDIVMAITTESNKRVVKRDLV